MNEVSGSNLALDTDCHQILHDFPQSIHATTRTMPFEIPVTGVSVHSSLSSGHTELYNLRR
jgi:hypothetical protein